MPPIFKGSFKQGVAPGIHRAEFDYNYPADMDLKPGSEFHDKLRDTIMQQAVESSNQVSARHPDFREVDRTMTGYINLDKEEKAIKKDDDRKPVSIVVPIQYAAHQVLLTYMTSLFMEVPVFRVEGVERNDIRKAIILENLLNYQARKRKFPLALYTLLSDAYKYNMGIMYNSYVTELGPSFTTLQAFQGGVYGEEFEAPQERAGDVLYEGNDWRTIDPYTFLPNMNFNLHDVNSHEYVSWLDRYSYGSLLNMEAENPDDWFNIQYTQFIDGRSEIMLQNHSGREDRTGTDKNNLGMMVSPVDIMYHHVRLIPSIWGLGDGHMPEDWFFKIAGDQIIVGATPLNFRHGKKNLVVASPDFDGHTPLNVSRMEMGQPLQKAIDYLYNNHITNQRKMINNMLVVDPEIVNYNDVTDTRAGAVIRIRKAQWGLGRVKDGVYQLPINDVTRGNMIDMQFIRELHSFVVGSESISGQINQKRERISSAETRSAVQAAVGRLQKDAIVMWWQIFPDLIDMAIGNISQFMDDEQIVRIVNTLPEDLKTEFGEVNGVPARSVSVKKSDFDDFRYDYLPSDGALPGHHDDPQAVSNFMASILGTQNPEVLQNMDFMKMITSLGRRMGIKETLNWIRNKPIDVQVRDNNDIQENVRNGNLQPIGGPDAV